MIFLSFLLLAIFVPILYLFIFYATIILQHRFIPKHDGDLTMYLIFTLALSVVACSFSWGFIATSIGMGQTTTCVLGSILGIEILISYRVLGNSDGFTRPSLEVSPYNSKELTFNSPYRASLAVRKDQTIFNKFLCWLLRRQWSEPLFKH